MVWDDHPLSGYDKMVKVFGLRVHMRSMAVQILIPPQHENQDLNDSVGSFFFILNTTKKVQNSMHLD
ncbi:hypothetical protein CHI08_13920 [Peribacillus simplex]|nr:hypothetical protein CHI08_13920 [Peribacillus simplex]